MVLFADLQGRHRGENTGFTLIALILAIALFLGMLTVIRIGHRLGLARLARDPEDGLAKGTGASEGAVFALLGLILAFTFSGAASRFEARRQLITEEVNDIGTAFLRIELVPEEARPELRQQPDLPKPKNYRTFLEEGSGCVPQARCHRAA